MPDLSMVFDLLAKDRASSEVGKVGDSMKDAGDDADGLGERVKGMFGKLAATAAGAGLAVGAAFMGAIENESSTNLLAGQMGLPPDMAAELGAVAGKLYAANYGESVGDATQAIRATMQSGLLEEDATNAQIESMTGRAMSLAQAMGVDVADAANAAGRMMQTGLAANGDEALDLIARGMQQGADRGGDLLDVLGEYGTTFQELGVSGPQAVGLIDQALAAGIPNADFASDALREMGIIGREGGEAAADAIKSLGLNSADYFAAMQEGGPAAAGALDKMLDALRNTEDPALRSAAATALVGTQYEDLGDAILAMDPSKAAADLGTVEGAATGLDSTLAQGLGPRLETLKRGLQTAATGGVQALIAGFTQGKTDAGGWQGTIQNLAAVFNDTFGPALSGLATFITDTLLPKFGEVAQWMTDNKDTVSTIATVVTTVMVPALAAWGTAATVNAGKNVLAWFAAAVAAQGSAAAQGRSVAQVAAGWLIMGARATLQGLKIAAVWAVQMVAAAAAGAASFMRSALRVVAGWVLMGAQALIQAGRMAAAWFIAMGPVGWIIAAVVGLGLLIWANWDKVKKWTKAAWDWVWDKLKGAWQSIKSTVTEGVGSVVEFVKGIPGKIGDMGKALYQKGKDMINGLIEGAGSLLKNVGRFFLDLLPGWIRGPFEKALGISSPSKVFRKYGVNIGQGLIKGLNGSEKDVKAASKKLGGELVKAFHAALKNSDLRSAQRALDAIDVLKRGDDQLIAVAKTRDKVAGQLEKARDRLADAVKMRNDFAGSVRDSALQFASLTSIKTAGSPRVMVDELQQRLTAITTFRTQLAKLAKMGVSRDVYQQIAEAGVEAGGATADALLAGGPKTVKQVNALQSKIGAASKGLGADATRKLYQAGVDAAQGLVAGLSKQSKGLTQAADRLAQQLTDAVKRRLGIRSPSTVFEGIGTNIGQGLADGIASMRPVVASELASLADLQSVQSLQQTLGVDAGGGTAAGYRPPTYDTSDVGAAAAPAASNRTVTVSGVVGPAEVAALVVREQRRDEFLAGAGS